MNDQTTVRSNQPELAGRTSVGDLDYKVASILCYVPFFLVGIISSIVWLKTEPKANRQLRFHAIQGLALAVTILAIAIANSIFMTLLVPLFGFEILKLSGLGGSLISLACLGACVYGIYSLWNGKDFRLPILGDFAEKNA